MTLLFSYPLFKRKFSSDYYILFCIEIHGRNTMLSCAQYLDRSTLHAKQEQLRDDKWYHLIIVHCHCRWHNRNEIIFNVSINIQPYEFSLTPAFPSMLFISLVLWFREADKMLTLTLRHTWTQTENGFHSIWWQLIVSTFAFSHVERPFFFSINSSFSFATS